MLGRRSRAAISSVQDDKGLQATGFLTPDLTEALQVLGSRYVEKARALKRAQDAFRRRRAQPIFRDHGTIATRSETTTATQYWDGDEAMQCRHANGADRALKTFDGDHWKLPSANCNDGHVHTAPVGSFVPNEFGLEHMLGNVWEWVEDCWNPDYSSAPGDASARDGDCTQRVRRGGSWYIGPWGMRSAYRAPYRMDNRNNHNGFRVARTLD